MARDLKALTLHFLENLEGFSADPEAYRDCQDLQSVLRRKDFNLETPDHRDITKAAIAMFFNQHEGACTPKNKEKWDNYLDRVEKLSSQKEKTSRRPKQSS